MAHKSTGCSNIANPLCAAAGGRTASTLGRIPWYNLDMRGTRMTTGERLARKMCEARREELRTIKQIAINEAKTLKAEDVPLEIRRSAARSKVLHKQADVLEARVKAVGFGIDSDGALFKLRKGYSYRSDVFPEIDEAFGKRHDKLSKIERQVQIDLLGATPVAAKLRLIGLQRELLTV